MIFALVGFLLTLSVMVSAQPEFSESELRLIKKRRNYSDALKYHLPQEKFPMPEIIESGNSDFADGNLDLTFNASFTEGFGYVNETVVQPDGKIIAVGLFQRANGLLTNNIAIRAQISRFAPLRFNRTGKL